MKNTGELKMTNYFFRDGEKVEYKIFDDNGKLVANRYCGKCGGTGLTPYYWVHGGTCFRCDGSKIEPNPQRVFTQEELDRLNKNQEARIEKKVAKHKAENTFTFSGLTFWFNSKQFKTLNLADTWKDLDVHANYQSPFYRKTSIEYLQSKTQEFWVKLKSDFVELGKCVKELTLIFKHGFETQYGYSEIFKFIDSQDNQYVWFTSSYPELEKGKTYNAQFIVKDNKESEEYGKQNMIKNFKEVK